MPDPRQGVTPWGAVNARRVLVVVLLGAACGAGWRQPETMPTGAIKPSQQVQVWHDGRYERWQAVRVAADSISGVHFAQRADCDSCRVALPLTAVDSIRYGDPVAGFWNTIGLSFVVIFVTFGIVCGRNGCHPGN